ncbi:MAG: hypothetical protein LBP63_05870 [Prevotellaceae bacterium]|jgi:hypothetical protein|nr:hypothetical protein [Prevotellaceae bacterium]
MKKIILQTTAILLMLAGIVACGKEENEKHSTEIPLTEYSLTNTNCQWVNLDYNGSVIVINSKTELEKYITCTEGTFPEIDFAKNTLLIACGSTTNGIQYIQKKFFKKINMYMLEIEITLNDATVAQPWIATLVTNKLSVNNVELNVITIKN